MANFTIQLGEYIQEHMNQGQSIENLDDILDVSKECLFNGAPMDALNALSDDYRDAFIQGFTMHFLFDEIGLETMTAWKLALASQIIDNVDFIETTYENLQNQIFSEYEVRKVDSLTKNTGKVQTDGELNKRGYNEQNNTLEFKGKEKEDNSRHYTAEDAQGNKVTPKITQIRTDADGDDPIKEYSQSVQSGTIRTDLDQDGKVIEKVEDKGKTKQHETSDGQIIDTTTDSGKEKMKEGDGAGDKAYVERTPSGERINTRAHKGGMMYGFSDHATDSTAAISNTPQSGINASDIMDSVYSPSQHGGTGSTVEPTSDSSKKYLSQAQHQWNNDRAHSKWETPIDNVNGDVIESKDSFNQYKDKQVTHYNREQERSFDNRQRENVREFNGYEHDIEQSFENRERDVTREFENYHTDNDTTYDNLTNKIEHHYNRKSSSETVYNDNFTEHQDRERSFENRKNEQESRQDFHADDISHGVQERNLKNEGELNEKKFKFNYEMYMKSEPFLKKLWSRFDELFFLLLDTL